MNGIKRLNNKLEKFDKIIVGEVAILCIMILPIIVLSLYSVPSSDDFFKAYAIKLNLEEGRSYLQGTIRRIIDLYRTSGGYFFANFLSYLFSPLVRGGVNALRGVNFVVNIFFYFSLVYIIYYIIKNVCKVYDRRIILLGSMVILGAVTNNDYHSEVVTRYCVVVEYVLLVTGMLWGIFFFIKAIQSEKNIYIFMASLIGFFMSGGALNITALNCLLYLVVGAIGFIKYNKKKTAFICFFSALAGGLINAAAPGNFIRHESVSSSYPIGSALKADVFQLWSRWQFLMFETPFILLLLIFFLLIFSYTSNGEREKMKNLINPIWVGCVALLSALVVNFPVCLGYSNGTFPDRCVWVEDCCIYLGAFGWMAYLVGWIKNRYGSKIVVRKDMLLCIIISSILFLCNLGSVRTLDSYPTVQIIKQLTNGQAAEFAEYWDGVFEEIESTDYGEVIIYRDEIKKSPFIYGPGIDNHTDNWINSAAAHYYGKDWICILKKE